MAHAIRVKRSKPRRVAVKRDRGYLDFLRAEGRCVLRAYSHRCEGPIDPCHGPVNGMGSKGDDYGAIPMCRKAHNEQGRLGWPNFQLKYGLNRLAEAALWRGLFELAKKRGMHERNAS